MTPDARSIKKIWQWTQSDTEQLFKPFICFDRGELGAGPSSGYAIYLACLMDIWGSIFRGKFNERNQGTQNVAEVLSRLKMQYPNLYPFVDVKEVADIIRNNLAHCYGLRVLQSGVVKDWLNIDVNSVGPIINEQDDKRFHIDCMRLKDHLLQTVQQWLKEFNYL